MAGRVLLETGHVHDTYCGDDDDDDGDDDDDNDNDDDDDDDDHDDECDGFVIFGRFLFLIFMKA